MERVANVINERPVGVMVHNKSEGPMLPLTPNMLMLGKSANTGPAAEEEYVDIKDKYAKLIKSVRRIEDEWWRQWYQQVFHYLLPYNKWSTKHRNLAVGDVCLNKVQPGKADYRLCRVSKVEKDHVGLVRTCTWR